MLAFRRLIKDFNAFMFDNNRGNTHRKFCKRCFGHSVTEQALNNHQRYCTHPEVCNQVIILPAPGTKDHFHNSQNKYTCPIVVYADCEAITKPVSQAKSKGGQYQQHIPCSVAYKVVSSVKGYPDKPLKLYIEEDCVERFLRDMLELEEEIASRLLVDTYPYFYRIPEDDDKARRDFDRTTECTICRKPLADERLGREKIQ